MIHRNWELFIVTMTVSLQDMNALKDIHTWEMPNPIFHVSRGFRGCLKTCYGAGFQPFIVCCDKFLGLRPRLIWNAPLALRSTYFMET